MLKNNMVKIPNGRIKLLFTAIGVAGISYGGLLFSVLTGPRGIGKTVAIQTAAQNLKGMITVEFVQIGSSKDEILDRVCHKITNRKGSYMWNREFMKEVIGLYRSNTGKVPVVIIQANECSPELSAAACNLVDDFGLNVLIDCCERL